jgi:hypothetical protein
MPLQPTEEQLQQGSGPAVERVETAPLLQEGPHRLSQDVITKLGPGTNNRSGFLRIQHPMAIIIGIPHALSERK